ncbi:hypothetical protein LCM23_06395 [Cytobacillus kochii]|uniref:hypothetical protein n=1 Tax=Cytobacillus kochii TaxID=859143 RepID=UPI001CD64824|nr:hypothetical protein [Cytobacillus kochii]MCA1025715.1 hypothetical protein [Cytobacillus kochii]
MNLTTEDKRKLENTNLKCLAMQLQEGLIDMCNLDGDMSVLEFIKNEMFEGRY